MENLDPGHYWDLKECEFTTLAFVQMRLNQSSSKACLHT